MKNFVLLLLLLPTLLLPGCAHLPPGPPLPDPAVYRKRFETCCQSSGIIAAYPEAVKIWTILDQGKGSAQQIEAAIIQAAATLAADAAILVLNCAISSWSNVHPIQPGAAMITPSQGAVRIFRAKHLTLPEDDGTGTGAVRR